MKKQYIIYLLMIFIVFVILPGCKKNTPAAAQINNAPDLIVQAFVSTVSGLGNANVNLKNRISSEVITGAIVKVNSIILNESPPGDYYNSSMPQIVNGASVMLTVESSLGNIIFSATMPATSGQIISVPLSGVSTGSFFSLTTY